MPSELELDNIDHRHVLPEPGAVQATTELSLLPSAHNIHSE